MKLSDRIPYERPAYYEEGFRKVIHDNLPNLIHGADTKQIPNVDRITCKGSFYHLMKTLSIPNHLWDINLAANGYNHPNEYDGTSSVILVKSGEVNALMSIYRT